MRASKKSTDHPHPTISQLEQASNLFYRIEPRGLFYRAATELVTSSLDGRSSLNVAESIAVLLQTWNAQFYRFGRHVFDTAHFQAIEKLLTTHDERLRRFRERRLISLTADEFDEIVALFTDFELILGPVGAAKALHMLAPEFFPLWDRKIASGYGIRLGSAGENGTEYVAFMAITVSQIASLATEGCFPEILKRIDEFNYCWFTQMMSSQIASVADESGGPLGEKPYSNGSTQP